MTRIRLAPSAARTANSRDRPIARARSRICDVRTRNQEQEADGGEQHEQEGADIANDIFFH